MAVALRLMRFGKKGYPTYRIVVLDKRSKRDGFYIEKIGLYNPMTDKDQLIVNEERFQYWVKTGAQVSEGIRKLMSAKLPKSTRKISKIKVKKVAKPKEEKPVAPAAKVAAPAPQAETVAEAPVKESEPAASEQVAAEVVATAPEVKEDTAKTPPEPKSE